MVENHQTFIKKLFAELLKDHEILAVIYYVNNSGCDYSSICRLDLQGLGGSNLRRAILEQGVLKSFHNQKVSGFRWQLNEGEGFLWGLSTVGAPCTRDPYHCHTSNRILRIGSGSWRVWVAVVRTGEKKLRLNGGLVGKQFRLRNY